MQPNNYSSFLIILQQNSQLHAEPGKNTSKDVVAVDVAGEEEEEVDDLCYFALSRPVFLRRATTIMSCLLLEDKNRWPLLVEEY